MDKQKLMAAQSEAEAEALTDAINSLAVYASAETRRVDGEWQVVVIAPDKFLTAFALGALEMYRQLTK